MTRRPWLLAPLLVACRSEPPPRATDTVGSAPVVLDTSVAADTGCRKVGLWQWCSVLDRLERAGVVLTPVVDAEPNDLFRGERRTFAVGAGEDRLDLWMYPSVAARIADTEQLDSATVSPRGERRAWRVPPLLVTSNNLAALVITMNERTSERLSLALSAGLPQPRP